MKLLVMCSSAFQMVAAVQIIEHYYAEDTVDIIVCSSLANYKDIAFSIKKVKRYRHVYTIDSKKYSWQSWKYTFLGFHYYRNIEKELPHLKKTEYDIFMFGNPEGIAACIADYMLRKKKCHLYFFEDGFIAYSDYYRKCFEKAFYRPRLFDRIFYSVKRKTLFYIEKNFVFNPELTRDWKFDFKVVKIPSIKPGSKSINILNSIYRYDEMTDDYHKKYVFFEESYYGDGIEIGDVKMVELIADIVGKENLFVKIHPRNKSNRFKEMGYETNSNTSIPWEVIALNEDFSDTVLITISSGSSVTSYFVAAQKARKSIMLYDMPQVDKCILQSPLAIMDHICRNKDYFCFPKTKAELQKTLLE